MCTGGFAMEVKIKHAAVSFSPSLLSYFIVYEYYVLLLYIYVNMYCYGAGAIVFIHFDEVHSS